ncbi:hypothetical protein GPECTOR_13g652 [Gonium pectorale]|uniref:Inositol polyphosphate-related phosphatase domain-containing protein n=1 Tax=Gonium pectorale TaxID=33097 RepID=A0A150GN11_GONPE|nr:hypothetical protein GPECTOR_13g652 [Gonium pectorale]|eukprot:KXZ51165.1 hypothetical protein GPECTOR_13g652 [Gonium pectorale]
MAGTSGAAAVGGGGGPPPVLGSAASRRRHSVAVIPGGLPRSPSPSQEPERRPSTFQGTLPAAPLGASSSSTLGSAAASSFSAAGAGAGGGAASTGGGGRRGSVLLHHHLLQQHLSHLHSPTGSAGQLGAGPGQQQPPPAPKAPPQQTYKVQGVLQGVTDVAKVGGDFKEMWEERMKDAVGSGYFLVSSVHMGQIRLLLFARNDVYAAISDVRSGKQATGVAGVATNKGGVAISLRVWDTTMAFVNSHLAAHQDKTRARNNNYRDIIRGLKIDPQGSSMDVLTAFHHVVWMGDLNYRLDYGQQAITPTESPTAADFASLVGEVQRGYFAKLLEIIEPPKPLERRVGSSALQASSAGEGRGSITGAATSASGAAGGGADGPAGEAGGSRGGGGGLLGSLRRNLSRSLW